MLHCYFGQKKIYENILELLESIFPYSNGSIYKLSYS